MTIDDEKVDINEDAGEHENEDSMANQFLAFRVEDEDYGIEIRYVVEIIVVQKITEIPDTRSFIRGVINLRGKVIPVIDVRMRFDLAPREYDDRTCIVVVSINDIMVGLIVDMVDEVVNIPDDQRSPPPQINRGPGSRYIMGMGQVGEKVRILLDVARVLKDKEIEKLEIEEEICEGCNRPMGPGVRYYG